MAPIKYLQLRLSEGKLEGDVSASLRVVRQRIILMNVPFKTGGGEEQAVIPPIQGEKTINRILNGINGAG